MFYIPEEWLRNRDHYEAVSAILQRHLATDLRLAGKDPAVKAIEELKAIGEDTIVEKLKTGAFCL